jgi:hypothetical protein
MMWKAISGICDVQQLEAESPQIRPREAFGTYLYTQCTLAGVLELQTKSESGIISETA